MLDVPQAYKDALMGDYIKAHLITLNLNGGTLYYTESGIPITYQGTTFQNNGLVKDLGRVKSSSELKVNETAIQFSAADLTTMAAILTREQRGRTINVDKVLLNDDFEIIGNPVRISNWLITGFSSSDYADRESIVSIRIASEFARWQKPAGRRTTPASQQRFYAGDKGFQFAASVQKEQKWGAE